MATQTEGGKSELLERNVVMLGWGWAPTPTAAAVAVAGLWGEP